MSNIFPTPTSRARASTASRSESNLLPSRWAWLSTYMGRDCKSMSEDAGHAFFKNMNAVHNTGSDGFLFEELHRLFHRLMRQLECSVVHWDHPLRAKIDERSHRVFRAGVNVAVRSRLVSADRQQRTARTQAVPDLAEAAEICRIAGVVNGMFARADHVSAKTA